MNNADEFSQSLKRKILAEDRERISTLLDHANASADDTAGGRFGAAAPTRTVIGTAPIAYPQQPSTAPSNQMAMMPDEPLIDGRSEGNTLGYEIDRPDAPPPPEASVVRKGLRRM
jgi:hypothetical protein